MYSLELGVFMYKYSVNVLPNIFNDYFTKRPDIHGYQTRHVNDLNLTKNYKNKNQTKNTQTNKKQKKKNKTKQNKTNKKKKNITDFVSPFLL